ncbi:MAG: aldo/keto reductase [Planctomycetes bacterium]|nr:aldo/keto reductase [Planctomycetota bacterium]
MNRRRLGKNGPEVSEVGFGTWGIGRSMWVGARDEESARALHRAIDLGIDFVDTALAYGDGHSERLVGRGILSRKCGVRVATKVPPLNQEWPARRGVPVEDVFPANHIVACAERSLRNLGFSSIDLLQLHVWQDDWTDRGDWRDAVERLKREGKIRLFGISINDHEPENALRIVATGIVDTVQVIYNIFDQSPEDRLFPECLKRGVGVIARVPLDEGGLTGRVTPEATFPRGDFRNEYFAGDRKREVFERVTKIAADLDVPLERMPQIALRFVLSHPAVSTVIPGMRCVANVEANVAVGDGRGLPAEAVAKLRAHRWARNFYS